MWPCWWAAANVCLAYVAQATNPPRPPPLPYPPLGAEEVPEGCVALLVGSSSEGGGSSVPDVLSHSAVRARNMGVLLAGCHSAEVRRGRGGGRCVRAQYVLSHSAVRARNMGVLLAGCHSAEVGGSV